MDIFIYGTGGHAKVIFDSVTSIAGYNVVCFVDDLSNESEFLDLPILKTPEAIKLTKAGVIAIGANHIRQKVFSELKAINANINFVSIVHSSAIVSPLATVNQGTVIMSGAIVNAGAVIEDNCVVNTGAILEHDCLMKKFSSIAPGVIVGGKVEIGERSFIGLGSKLKHGIKIGDDSVLGMGSVAVADIGSLCLAYGNPCKKIKNRKENEGYLS